MLADTRNSYARAYTENDFIKYDNKLADLQNKNESLHQHKAYVDGGGKQRSRGTLYDIGRGGGASG